MQRKMLLDSISAGLHFFPCISRSRWTNLFEILKHSPLSGPSPLTHIKEMLHKYSGVYRWKGSSWYFILLSYVAIWNSGILRLGRAVYWQLSPLVLLQNISNLEYIIYYGGNTIFHRQMYMYFILLSFLTLCLSLIFWKAIYSIMFVRLCIWFLFFVSMVTRKSRILQLAWNTFSLSFGTYYCQDHSTASIQKRFVATTGSGA